MNDVYDTMRIQRAIVLPALAITTVPEWAPPPAPTTDHRGVLWVLQYAVIRWLRTEPDVPACVIRWRVANLRERLA